MIQEIQARMGMCDLWEMKPVLLHADSGAVTVHRITSQLADLESQAKIATLSAA